MAKHNGKKNQKDMTQEISASDDNNDIEEDLLYIYKQKNDTSQMRWNNSLCRKPQK